MATDITLDVALSVGEYIRINRKGLHALGLSSPD